MRRIALIFILLTVLLIFVFLNLGRFLDVTEEPVTSDIIVCLGGGTVDRVKKSIALLEEGYAKKQLFLLIGESWYNQPYIAKNHPGISLTIEEGPKNTREEVLFIKEYMKKYGYKSALIVTDPPHSRRVSFLTSLVSIKGDEKMTFHIVGSDVKWWNKEQYYLNERAKGAAKNESMGILYSVIAYGFLDKIGLLDEFEAWRKN